MLHFQIDLSADLEGSVASAMGRQSIVLSAEIRGIDASPSLKFDNNTDHMEEQR